MKSTVCVGVTMKSIDYFQFGLPIINNIPHDTEKIVREYKCGYNISDIHISELATIISKLDETQLAELKCNARNVYCTLLVIKYFMKSLIC